MTFEELKEMIDSTINENGCGAITGKALNLALNEILNGVQQYVEENKPEGGAASEIIYLPDMNTGEMDPEHLTNNIAVYNKFKTAFEEGKPLPLLSIDASIMLYEIEQQLGVPSEASGYFPCSIVIFVSKDSPLVAQAGEGVMFIFSVAGSDAVDGILQPDGNIMMM